MISLCRRERMSSFQRYLLLSIPVVRQMRASWEGGGNHPSSVCLNFWWIKFFQRITTSFPVWPMLYSLEGLHNHISWVPVTTTTKHLVAKLSIHLSCIQKLKAAFQRGTVPIQPHGDLAIPAYPNSMSQFHTASHELMLLLGRYNVHHFKQSLRIQLGGGSLWGVCLELQRKCYMLKVNMAHVIRWKGRRKGALECLEQAK